MQPVLHACMHARFVYVRDMHVHMDACFVFASDDVCMVLCMHACKLAHAFCICVYACLLCMLYELSKCASRYVSMHACML